jgi:hypothetical protein
MKNHLLLAKMLMIMTFTGLLSPFMSFLSAQTTITTTLTNNNGSSVAVFSFQNNNPDAVIITDIGSVAGVTNTYTCHLYALPVTYNVAPGAATAITAANGWTLVASNSSLTLTGSTSSNVASPFISGMSYVVPGNSQVRFALQLATGAGQPAFTTTAGNLRYSTVGTQQDTWSSGGCDIRLGTNHGYGGTMTSFFTPRGFIGFVSFQPANDCSGTPNPGNTLSSVSAACANQTVNLSLQNSQDQGTTYQWQSADDIDFTSNVQNLGTTSNQSTTITGNTYFRCQVTCTFSGETTISTPVLVTLNSFFNCYCFAGVGPTSTADSEILGVTLNGEASAINNSTPCPALTGVRDFTSQTVTLMEGNTYDLNVLMGVCGSFDYNNTLKAWIDYNQDGIWDQTTEQLSTFVTQIATVAGANGTLTFTVPFGASLGTTRMRVMMRETGTESLVFPCAGFSWGSVHDYSVEIVANTSCTGTPNPGNTISSVPNVCSGTNFLLSLQNQTLGSGVSYQWQTSPDGSSWSNAVGSPNSATWSTNQSSATWYRCIVTCASSGESTESVGVQVAMSSFFNCYCTANVGPTSTGDSEILGVTLSGEASAINNSTPCPGELGLQDYTSQSVDLMEGMTYDLNVLMGVCGTFGYTNTLKAWIDYNQDGVWDVNTEQLSTFVTQAASVSGVNGTLTFTVPFGTPLGATRMRVMMRETGTESLVFPCAGFTWGSAHDYTINIVSNTPCAGTPNPGNTISSASNPCATDNFTLSLQNATTGSGVSYQWQTSNDGLTWSNAVGAPNAANWNLSHSSATWYRCIVTCNSESTESVGVLVGISVCYCVPTYTSGTSAGDLISAVSISGTTLDNNVGFTAGQPSYLDFYNSILPNQTGTLNAASSYTLTISTGEWGDQGIAVWIDFNENGIFEASELVGTSATVIGSGFTPGQVNATASFNITLPCNPLPGDYRMRVRGVYFVNGPLIDPCASYTWGQTHDYRVTVAPPPPCPAISNLTVSSITQNSAVVSWTQGCDENAWDVHISESSSPPTTPDIIGWGSTTYSASGLNGATQYYAHVRANCGLNGESEWTTVPFQTLPPPPACATGFNLIQPNCGPGSNQVTWNPVPNATGYNIFAGLSSGNYSLTPPEGVFNSNPEIFLNNPDYSTTYYMLVVPTNQGSDAVGCIEYVFTSQDEFCPPPANNNICDALEITSGGAQDVNTYSFYGDMTCFNQAGSTIAANGTFSASCGALNNPVWYTFTAPLCDVGGLVPFQIQFTTFNAGNFLDSRIALFSATGDVCTGALAEVACNGDTPGGTAASTDYCGVSTNPFHSTVFVNLEPGKQYWLAVANWGAFDLGAQFVVSARALPPSTVVTSVSNGTQLQITTQNMGANLYTYYYRQVGSSGYSVSNSTNTTDVRSLASGVSYETQVMYRCGTNTQQSQFYRTEVQTTALQSSCAIVNDMTCEFNGNNTYTLTWAEPSGSLFTNDGQLSGYRVKRNPIGSTSVFTFGNPAVVCSNGVCSVTLPGASPTGFNWTIETRCSATNIQVGNTSSCTPQNPEFSGNNNNNLSSLANKSMQHAFSFVNAQAGIEFVDVQMYDAYADFGLNTPLFGDYEIFVNDNNEISWRRVDTPVDANFDFVIVPNPSNAMTTVFLNTIVEEGSFTIVDAMGRTIQTGSINNTDNVNFDAAQLQSGVYMVVVTVGNQKMTRRLVVAD